MTGLSKWIAALTFLIACVACHRSQPAVVAEPDPPDLDLSSQPTEVRQAVECAGAILKKERLLGERPLLLKVTADPDRQWTVRFEARGANRGVVEVSVSTTPCTSQRVLVFQ